MNNKLLFILIIWFGSIFGATTTSTRWHTSRRLHTVTATSTVRSGVLRFTIYKDIYDDTTLVNTISAPALTRVSATSVAPITSVPATTALPTMTTNRLSSLLSSSARTTTSVIFSSSAEITTSIAGSTGSSVSQDTSRNPLITSSIVVSTSNSVSINVATLTSATVIPTSITSTPSLTVESSPLVTTSVVSSSSQVSSSKSSSSKVSSSSHSSSSKVSSSSKSSSSHSSSASTSSVAAVLTSTSYSGDLFSVIDTSEPPSVFTREDLIISLASGVDNGDSPYETNKFFTNMMMGDQTDTVFVHPYSVWWDQTTNYGMAIGHTTSSQYVYGSHDWATYGYYINPLDIGQLIFSATEFDSSVTLGLTEMKELSALAKLSLSSSDYIDFPIVEGMGFVSAIYNGDLIPQINSDMAVLSLSKETSTNLASGILKYRISLNNDVDWLIYITLPDGYTSNSFNLTASNSIITGSAAIDGLIMQLAIAPDTDSAEVYYDTAAGMYATSASVSGSVVNSVSAQYLITYDTTGLSLSGDIIVHLLPHQVDSLSSSFTGTATNFYLDSTTKGKMYAYLTTQVIMSETLETDIQFLPWVPGMDSLTYTADQLTLIAEAANLELDVNIKDTVADLDSTYYSGKVIDKYAYILLTVSEIIGDEDVTLSTLENLKDAFSTFTSNTQYYPFIYDTKFKGVTSSGAQSSGDTGVDFGSPIYNDHHFHYGYFVHAAAVVGYIDAKHNGTWAEDNKDWVNSLIRDVANPSSSDSYFPVSRMFDWFHGHSWAAGLDASGDGKNQESSSEDYNFAYGMKLWGRVIGDQSMESRGDLMLAVSKRAMNMYYLFSDDNEVEPAHMIGNKVAGILFENKMDYTTYFGSNLEYIHGIHMLPITPASSLVRGSEFTSQEWDQRLSSLADGLDSGWAGILRLNQALFSPSTSYSFFSSSSFSSDYLDNGQSLTWCLAFSAGALNAST